ALSDILNQESYEADIFRYGWISRTFPLNDFRIRLQHLITLVATFQTMYSSPVTLRDALKESPEHWFLGHDLRCIFEKHFKLQATRSREVDGSRRLFVCFAIAVSSALGWDVSDSTVSKAMPRSRERHVSRGRGGKVSAHAYRLWSGAPPPQCPSS